MPVHGNTLADLKAKIAQDLRRSNLTAEIADAIPDAIRDHETERFWWNETFPQPYTLTVTPGGGQGGSGVPGNTGAQGDLYLLGSSGLPNFQEFIKIDMVRAQLGGGSVTGNPQGLWYTVKAIDWTPLEFFYSVLSNGQPSWWAYRNNYLRIYPLPSQAYPLRIFGHYRATPLVNDTDSNIWTNQGFNLIRYTVLRRLYTYPIRDAAQVQNASQAGEATLQYLRTETDRRSRQGRMRAYYG